MTPMQNDSYPDGVLTMGGYSTGIIANEQFVFSIPDEVTSEDAATMFCAGLTVFAPLIRNNIGPGKKVGVIGIGGLVSVPLFYFLIFFSLHFYLFRVIMPFCSPRPSELR